MLVKLRTPDGKQRVLVDESVSDWKPVLSGVPLGSVWQPLLYFKFNKFNNDDDLQKDLEKLKQQPKKWQIVFNFDKCSYLGHGKPNLAYKMENVGIGTPRKEKDLRGNTEC